MGRSWPLQKAQPLGAKLNPRQSSSGLAARSLEPPRAAAAGSESQVLAQRALGRGAAGILMQPDGARAYIACGPDNSVAVLDLKTFAVLGRIDVGGEPDGLAWAVRQ